MVQKGRHPVLGIMLTVLATLLFSAGTQTQYSQAAPVYQITLKIADRVQLTIAFKATRGSGPLLFFKQ
jgi:hypothetical protein